MNLIMLQMAFKNISKRKTSNINTLMRSYYKYPKVKLHRKSVLSCWFFYVKIVSFSFCVDETGKKKLDFVSELPYFVVNRFFYCFQDNQNAKLLLLCAQLQGWISRIQTMTTMARWLICKAGYPGFKP